MRSVAVMRDAMALFEDEHDPTESATAAVMLLAAILRHADPAERLRVGRALTIQAAGLLERLGW